MEQHLKVAKVKTRGTEQKKRSIFIKANVVNDGVLLTSQMLSSVWMLVHQFAVLVLCYVIF